MYAVVISCGVLLVYFKPWCTELIISNLLNRLISSRIINDSDIFTVGVV